MYQAALTSFSKAALDAQGPCPRHAVVVSDAILVGALLKPFGNAHTLEITDDMYLADMITAGPRTGLWFAPDFTAHVCNLRYQHDFLKVARKPLTIRPQLVSFNYVYYSRRGASHCVDKRVYSQSVDAFQDGAWHEALMGTGASHAINIHKTGEELPTDILNMAPFSAAHTGRTCCGKQMDVLVRRDLVGQRLVA